MKIANQVVGLRRRQSCTQANKACRLTDMQIEANGLGTLWPYHQAQPTPTCIIIWETRRHAQPGQAKNDVDGEHDRGVRIGLCVEATRRAKNVNLDGT